MAMMRVRNAIIMDKTPKMMFVRRSVVIDMVRSWSRVIFQSSPGLKR